MSEFEPADWNRTRVPRLSQLDSLMRCSICKDFLKAPVITACNHTFCSQCIRQHLMNESNCPLCKVELFESNLKRVIVLEELVACFQSARDDLISELSQEASPGKDAPPSDPPRSSAARHPASKRESSSDVEIIEVSSEEPREGRATCPVCSENMSVDHLQRHHLDLCLRGQADTKLKAATPKRKRAEISSFFREKRPKKAEVDHESFYFGQAHKHHHEAKRIPKIDFSSVSTAKLKEKLAALKLATSGTRPQMELRYNQFYLLQNSNLDSNHPQTDLELRQKLKQWETSHSAFSAPVSSNAVFGDSHKSLTDKNFSATAWKERYRAEFRVLVRAARKSRAKKEAAKDSDDTTPAPGMAKESGPEVREECGPSAVAARNSLPDADPDAGFDFSKSILFPH